MSMKTLEKTSSRSSMQSHADRKVRVHTINHCLLLLWRYVFSGKRVFKKSVKFLIKFVPAETAGEPSDSDHGDGKTFIVSFVQTSGEWVQRSGGVAMSSIVCRANTEVLQSM